MKLDQLDHKVHYYLPVFPAGTQRRKSIYEGKCLCLRLDRLTSRVHKHIETLTDELVSVSINLNAISCKY